MWIFRSVFVLAAYIFIIVYTGFRVFAFVKYFMNSLRTYIFWPIWIIFGFSYMIVFFLRLDRIWPLRLAVMYSLPFLVYFCMILLILEPVRLYNRLKDGKRKLYKNNLPLFSACLTGICLGVAILVMCYGAFNARNIRTVHYEITVNKQTGNGGIPGSNAGAIPGGEAGLRIALFSDTHIGHTVNRKWLAKIVDAANSTNADIICITGDIFDNNIETLGNPEGITEELRRLSAPLGVYACQGNHDVDRLSLREPGSVDRILDFLDNAGVKLLLDEVILVADSIYLAGRKDVRLLGSRQTRKTAAELAVGLDASKPLIFMDHQPVDFPGIEEAGADLILSGHTHGGQFFPGNIATVQIYKNTGATHYGHWRGNSAQGVVSSGAGVWGPPIRIYSKSEVAVLNIKFIDQTL